MINKLLRTLLVVSDFVFDQGILLAARLNIITRYQPIFGDKEDNSQRSCIDRWRVIEQHLPVANFSFLDIGSQLGYFTLSAARRGAMAMGVERVMTYYRVAEAVRRQANIKTAAFYNIEFNKKSIMSLPRVDVTCCMSVFHHWVNDWGKEEAISMLGKVCANTQILIFETGQPNEENQNWTQNVEFMYPDPKKWIDHTLTQFGFTKIEHLGEFPTHLSRISRHLAVASKGK